MIANKVVINHRLKLGILPKKIISLNKLTNCVIGLILFNQTNFPIIADLSYKIGVRKNKACSRTGTNH